MKKICYFILLCLLSSEQVMAHATWIEKEGARSYLYFGEFAHDKKEKTGKVLDKIEPVILIGDVNTTDIKRLEDRIELLNTDLKKDLATYVVMQPKKMKNSQEMVQTFFLSRSGRTEAKALLDLDLIAKNAQSNEFTLVFKDKPLAKAVVVVTAPSKWEKRFRTNKAGKVSIQTPYRGMYLVEVIHKEGAKRYVYTLTFEVKKGLPWAYDLQRSEER